MPALPYRRNIGATIPAKMPQKENYNRNWPHAKWTIWKLGFRL
jgi:hypothetical protein